MDEPTVAPTSTDDVSMELSSTQMEDVESSGTSSSEEVHEFDTWLNVPLQWVITVIIAVTIPVWLAIGNVAEGTIGHSPPVDSWLVPLSIGVLGYITAYGFMSPPPKAAVKEFVPLLTIIVLVPLFAWRNALLPFVIGCSSASFMLILVIFNTGVQVKFQGKAVVDYDFAHYRGYVALVLVIANGVFNALGYILENDAGAPTWCRWLVSCFLGPTVLGIMAAISIMKGKGNGQYNVPNEGTFWRLFVATRLGIYFCMYYLVHYHFEAMIVSEVLGR